MRFLTVLCITLATAVSFTIAADNKRCKRPIARAESCDCEPKSAGLLKMSGGKLVVCDGSEWKTHKRTGTFGLGGAVTLLPEKKLHNARKHVL